MTEERITKERMKQIDDLLEYMIEYDFFKYVCVFDYCTPRRIPIYEYLGSILDMSEKSGKEPMVIIRNLFPDD